MTRKNTSHYRFQHTHIEKGTAEVPWKRQLYWGTPATPSDNRVAFNRINRKCRMGVGSVATTLIRPGPGTMQDAYTPDTNQL